MEAGYVTEIPSYLKQLARLTTRAFFQIEDSLLMDMLVRNVCMREKQIEDLLKFDSKLLRARLATLKSEKFVQTRLRMETGPDGKAQKVNYYFINYKNLVNVIKYKLDHIRKKLETQERDATNRASFKCTNCAKTFTDLEAGELFDPMTQNFYCTFCRQIVEEDEAASAPKDSRLLLAKYNEQLHLIFDLLRKAENIKLAPELLDPEPPKGFNDPNDNNRDGRGGGREGFWSGEATRSTGGNDQTRIDITIGDESANKPKMEKKERPVWMTESTITTEYGNSSAAASAAAGSSSDQPEKNTGPREDIMSVLLAYEKTGGSGSTSQQPVIPVESDSDEDPDNITIPDNFNSSSNQMEVDDDDVMGDVEIMDDDDEDDAPMVNVGTERIPLSQVNEEVIAKMTPAEKETYVQQYQDFFCQD